MASSLSVGTKGGDCALTCKLGQSALWLARRERRVTQYPHVQDIEDRQLRALVTDLTCSTSADYITNERGLDRRFQDLRVAQEQALTVARAELEVVKQELDEEKKALVTTREAIDDRVARLEKLGIGLVAMGLAPLRC